MLDLGKDIYQFSKDIFYLNRSLTGEGVRETLNLISKKVENLKVKSFKSGDKVFDWKIPNEWKVDEAYILCPNKKKICDFKNNNLHLVGYSVPQNKTLNLENLQKNLFSLPNQPNAVPYVTSYYKKDWGFCITHNQRKKLKKGIYKVVIKSKHFKGLMNYGEVLIPGKTKKEIFLSTYICHPSMANNEVSGLSVLTFITKWLNQQKNLKYSYRIIFIPETIGSIAYLNKNMKKMKKNIIAGFNVSCVGDNRTFSFLPSRNGNTLSDTVARHVLKWIYPNFKNYTWLDRGSDERQYCAPGVDLPIASIMRSKYGEYPEYHTSLDNLEKVVSAKGLYGGYGAIKKAIFIIDKNVVPINLKICEPFMTKYNLYDTLSFQKNSSKNITNKIIMDIISYSDGKNSLLEISDKLEKPFEDIHNLFKLLKEKKILGIRNE